VRFLRSPGHPGHVLVRPVRRALSARRPRLPIADTRSGPTGGSTAAQRDRRREFRSGAGGATAMAGGRLARRRRRLRCVAEGIPGPEPPGQRDDGSRPAGRRILLRFVGVAASALGRTGGGEADAILPGSARAISSISR
jgi:hypothetical protein